MKYQLDQELVEKKLIHMLLAPLRVLSQGHKQARRDLACLTLRLAARLFPGVRDVTWRHGSVVRLLHSLSKEDQAMVCLWVPKLVGVKKAHDEVVFKRVNYAEVDSGDEGKQDDTQENEQDLESDSSQSSSGRSSTPPMPTTYFPKRQSKPPQRYQPSRLGGDSNAGDFVGKKKKKKTGGRKKSKMQEEDKGDDGVQVPKEELQRLWKENGKVSLDVLLLWLI